MATYDLATTGTSGYPAMDKSGVYRLEKKVDFSAITATVQNDVLQVINIPANTWVIGVFYAVTTACTGLDDLDIGDGSGTAADGYHDGIDASSTGDGMSWATTFNEAAPPTTLDKFSLGKFYTAADTIDLTQNTDATISVGVIKLVALCVDCNPTT